MKHLFTAVALVAIINTLVLAGVAGWLAMNDRLDRGRLQQVRQMLSETITEQQAREAAAQAEQDRTAEAEALEARLSAPPVSASELLTARIEASEIDRQVIARLRREVDDLKAELSRERRRLDDDRAVFVAEKDAFEAMRERLQEIEGDEQFRKSLSVLEGLKPADAKTTLQQLIDAGGQEQVVSYLDAMQARIRTKVMAEFVKDAPDLAAELLEDLRVRGIEVAAQ